jgi:hypothetical protein
VILILSHGKRKPEWKWQWQLRVSAADNHFDEQNFKNIDTPNMSFTAHGERSNGPA